MLISEDLDRALRWGAKYHQGQTRRGSATPYFVHAVAVAMILDRLRFPDGIVIAGLLHDLVEDTEATIDDIRHGFGPEVAELVAHCSEIKTDATGAMRPWIDRKRDHLAALANTSADVRAVLLADKLHNLSSILFDLREGNNVWPLFHADRESVLWYYRTAIETLGNGTDALDRLAEECRGTLSEVEAIGPLT